MIVTNTSASSLGSLFGDSSVEDLCPEESALGLLNDLLVDVVGGVVHNDSAILAVNLGIQTRLADQVHDPLLSIIRVQAKLGAQVPDVHSAEDLAVALANEVSGSVDKGISGRSQEEIAAAHLLGHAESLTSSVKVVGNVEGVDKLGNGISILVGFLSNISNDIFELLLLDRAVACTCAAGDNGGNQIPQDPGAGGLDGVDVGSREEHVQDGFPGTLKVEQGEERPVNKHGPVVKLSSRVVEKSRIDTLSDVLKLINSRLPVRREDFGSKLSPCSSGHLVIVGGENSELVEHIGSRAILTASELELSKVIESIYHLNSDLGGKKGGNSVSIFGHARHFHWFACARISTYSVLVLEKLQVGHLVASQSVDDLVLGKEVCNLLRRLLVLVQLCQHILSLLGVLGRGLSHSVQLAVQRRYVVCHVGIVQQLNLA